MNVDFQMKLLDCRHFREKMCSISLATIQASVCYQDTLIGQSATVQFVVTHVAGGLGNN